LSIFPRPTFGSSFYRRPNNTKKACKQRKKVYERQSVRNLVCFLMNESNVPFLNPSTLKPSLNPILVTDGKGLEQVRQYLLEPRPFVLDYETNRVETFYRRRARTIQLGDRNVQFVIDLLAIAGSTERLVQGQGGYRKESTTIRSYNRDFTESLLHIVQTDVFEPVVQILRPALESDSHLKIGHNLEFEYIVGKWCLGLRTWHLWDTMLAERILLNGLIPNMQAGYFALDDVVRKYCGFQIDKEAQTTFDLETPLTEKQITYCALDVRLPWAVKSAQEVKLNKAQLGWTAQIEFDAIPAFGDMHLNGLYVNPAKWQAIIDANKEALESAVKKMDSFFIPIVGRKRAPDFEKTAELHAVWKQLGEKSYDEVVLSNRIKAARKDPALLERLKHERQTLELQRAERREEAKQAYQDEKRYTAKKYTDEYGKMEGEAEINYNSSDRIRDALLAGSFGFTERNLADTSDPTLEKFADLEVVQAIRDYRGYKKALGTYGDRWIVTSEQNCTLGRPKPGFVDPDTGRIHSRFLQLGTDTGRPSSTNPNVLNLLQDKRIRESFEARAGYDLVTKDCAGQELVILTEYSGEPTWVAAFNAKQDIHSVSTSIIVPELWKAAAIHEETTMVVDGVVTKIPRCAFYYKNKEKCKCPKHVEYRNRYKAATLGLIMGKEAYSLGVELHISTEQSQAIIDQWMNAFKKNKQAIQYNQDVCYDKGEARTLGGRRRIMRPVMYEQAKKAALEKYGQSATQQQINTTMAKMVKAVKREGGNVCYQGTAADLMKTAMGCGFDQDGKPFLWHILEPQYGALIENYVYDEFVVESPEEHSEKVSELVSDAIIQAGAMYVKKAPMKSDGGIAKVWRK
jgi:DNA polymerase I-like protein with 3'-5' exonuclease and polymerase domains